MRKIIRVIIVIITLIKNRQKSKFTLLYAHMTNTNLNSINTARWEKAFKKWLTPFEEFIHRQTTGGLMLMVFTILALILANSRWAPMYYDWVNMPMRWQLGSWSIDNTLQHWINEGLMSFFFLIVGLELKREILVGDLSQPRVAALPLIGALGGMLIPAFIYTLFNFNTPGISGWGVPMATDIAFAVGLLVLLGKRIPNGLVVFLVALAIADDLGAVLVIALFYTEKLQLIPLLFSGIFILALVILNLWGVRKSTPYFIVWTLLWFAMLESGIHATLSGIITAACIPAYPKYNPSYYTNLLTKRIEDFAASYKTEEKIIKNEELRTIVQLIEEHTKEVQTPLQRVEHKLQLPVSLVVIPLFAFFNAGVTLPLESFAGLLTVLQHPVTIGITLGLLLGKMTGIMSFCWVSIKLKWAQLPENTNYRQLLGVAFIAGIGFTMSLFIAELAFAEQSALLDLAKIGILLGSLISAIMGIVCLLKTT